MKFTRLLVVVAIVLAATTLSSVTASAGEFTFKITTVKQGLIKGGKNGVIPIYGYEFSATAGTAISNTTPATRRGYGPILIRKDLDIASPALLQALATNEEVKSVVIQAKVPPKGEATAQPYTITLANARIVSVRQLPDERGNHYEEVSIAFQKITVEMGGSFFQDEILPQ